MHKVLRAVTVAAAFVGLFATILVFQPTAASAATNGADFVAGRIISDSNFYNSSAMTADQIQSFLNAHGSNCASRTSATCLKNYTQTTQNRVATDYCAAYAGKAGETAAQIIANVGVACGISQKVLVVMLQKEQSLVTTTSPSDGAYRIAMGYGCPDSSGCDATYYGFFNQVFAAANQFQHYTRNASTWSYQAGRNNQIFYNTDTSCGTATVYIQNQATANLYNYTPYTPNKASLADLDGSGDACSSYGNRNFWRFYSDWFGSPIAGIDRPDSVSLVDALYADILGRTPDKNGLTSWSTALINKGSSVVTVANGVLYSREYYLSRIDAAYRTVLGREPDARGRDAWLASMLSGKTSVDTIAMTFTESAEYYRIAGGTDTAFITKLFATLLQRAPSAAELSDYSAMLRSKGTAVVVTSVYNSNDSVAIRINAIYQTYLKRSAGSSGVAAWKSLVIAQGDQALRTAIVSSAEYLSNARTRFP